MREVRDGRRIMLKPRVRVSMLNKQITASDMFTAVLMASSSWARIALRLLKRDLPLCWQELIR